MVTLLLGVAAGKHWEAARSAGAECITVAIIRSHLWHSKRRCCQVWPRHSSSDGSKQRRWRRINSYDITERHSGHAERIGAIAMHFIYCSSFAFAFCSVVCRFIVVWLYGHLHCVPVVVMPKLSPTPWPLDCRAKCGGIFDHYFVTKYCFQCFTAGSVLKQFLKSLNIWQSYVGKLIAASTLCAGALSCWKVKNSLEIWRAACRSCYNSIVLRLILHTNLDLVIKVSNWCNVNHFLLIDRCVSDWTLHMQAFCHDATSFLMDVHTVSHSDKYFFPCGHCKYVFASEQNNANIIGWILLAIVLNGWVLHGSAHRWALPLKHGNFWAPTFHEVL